MHQHALSKVRDIKTKYMHMLQKTNESHAAEVSINSQNEKIRMLKEKISKVLLIQSWVRGFLVRKAYKAVFE